MVARRIDWNVLFRSGKRTLTLTATASLAATTVATIAGGVAGVGLGTACANTVFSFFPWGADERFGKRAENYWKIADGLFATDKDKNFWQRTWQFTSRFTIEQPLTTIGYSVQNTIVAYSFFRQDEIKVGLFHGATVLQADWMNNQGGFTVGSYITMSNNRPLNYDNNLLLHEYGHYLQARSYGAIPMLGMSISSLWDGIISGDNSGYHDQNWTEQDAVARSLAYFGKRMTETQRDNFFK